MTTEAILVAMQPGGQVAPCRDVCWLPLPLSSAVCTTRANPIIQHLHKDVGKDRLFSLQPEKLMAYYGVIATRELADTFVLLTVQSSVVISYTL
jgi:hypothetical protein